MTATTAGRWPAGRPALRRPPAALARAGVVVAFLGGWQLVVLTGLVDRSSVPAPTDCLGGLGDVLTSAAFWADAARTAQTTLLAFGTATVAGLALGAALARLSLLRRILEPYLVGAYAVPVVVFYPTLLVVLGLGVGPIVVTAVLGAVVPVILTTVVALAERSVIHRKLARSLRCSRLQTLRMITVPGVLPLLLPGLKLAFVYALASTVGVEFIVADAGLGYRIGELYRNFETVGMYVHIVLLFVVALLVNLAFNLVERAARKDLG